MLIRSRTGLAAISLLLSAGLASAGSSAPTSAAGSESEPPDAGAAVPNLGCNILIDEFEDRSLLQSNTWPGGIVPYTFNANVSAINAAAMRSAMDLLERTSNITFVPRTSQADYVQIQAGSGNSSFVGRVGGAQTLNIVNWTYTYIMAHELMHALGQKHEQSRPDRATYVNVNYANIQAGYSHNFDISNVNTFGPYDFDSVMHYDPCGFSICCSAGSSCDCEASCAPIQALPAYASFQNAMGQRSHISALDAAGLAWAYGAPDPVSGPILGDGSMDSLASGNAPDYATPAGFWGFNALYQQAGTAEPVGRESVFSVVDTSTFQPGASGRSLRLHNPAGVAAENFHLANFFRKSFLAAPGLSISVAFDIWIPSGSTGGGTIYIGGDNGFYGYATSSRAAQISFYPNGNFVWHNGSGVLSTLVAGYPRNAWLNVRLVIDTEGRNYDLYYGVNGGAQAKLGNNLTFRAPTPADCWNFDRFTFVTFGGVTPQASSYLDNVVVTSSLCPADLTGDGYVDDADFVPFVAAYNILDCADPAMPGACPSDLNGDAFVDDTDFVLFASAYNELICP